MAQVKELRERTQAGLNDCRSALMEAEGDMDKAVEVILKKGLAKSAKRAGKVAAEGVVAAKIAGDGKSGVLVEVNIQTDFAARNPDFVAFVDGVVAAAAGADDGADLGALPHPSGEGTVDETRQKLVAKLGENITVRRWGRLRVEGTGKVHCYIHMGGRVGVIVAAETGSDAVGSHEAFTKFIDDTAMQIAAMNPQYLDTDGVDDEAKKKQAEIFAAQLAEENKTPEDKRPKIVEGKIHKWMKEVALLPSASVIESDKSVDKVRAEAAKAAGGDIKLTGFVRYEVGEGVEKEPAKDFASEVAEMAKGS